MKKIRRIGISTGGGDAPGLNAVIRAACLGAFERGWEVVGIRRGFDGLFDLEQTVGLDRGSVRGIAHLGGSILGTNSKGDPLSTPERVDQAVAGVERLGLDALVIIGGDGTMSLAHRLMKDGVRLVGVPKTIDNDLEGTVVTFGFDTAMSVATDAIDRIHSTAESHQRVFVIELMGRYAGWIALHAGIAGGADVILLPEIPFGIEAVCDKIRRREEAGRRFSIVVAAEGAVPVGGDLSLLAETEGGRPERLGGIAQVLVPQIESRTGKEARSLVLGHLQRGGRPSARDRVLALRFGAAAIRTLEAGEFGTMVALDPPNVLTVPLESAISRLKRVPLDGDTIATARDLSICLGD